MAFTQIEESLSTNELNDAVNEVSRTGNIRTSQDLCRILGCNNADGSTYDLVVSHKNFNYTVLRKLKLTNFSYVIGNNTLKYKIVAHDNFDDNALKLLELTNLPNAIKDNSLLSDAKLASILQLSGVLEDKSLIQAILRHDNFGASALLVLEFNLPDAIHGNAELTDNKLTDILSMLTVPSYDKSIQEIVAHDNFGASSLWALELINFPGAINGNSKLTDDKLATILGLPGVIKDNASIQAILAHDNFGANTFQALGLANLPGAINSNAELTDDKLATILGLPGVIKDNASIQAIVAHDNFGTNTFHALGLTNLPGTINGNAELTDDKLADILCMLTVPPYHESVQAIVAHDNFGANTFQALSRDNLPDAINGNVGLTDDNLATILGLSGVINNKLSIQAIVSHVNCGANALSALGSDYVFEQAISGNVALTDDRLAALLAFPRVINSEAAKQAVMSHDNFGDKAMEAINDPLYLIKNMKRKSSRFTPLLNLAGKNHIPFADIIRECKDNKEKAMTAIQASKSLTKAEARKLFESSDIDVLKEVQKIEPSAFARAGLF